MVWIWIPLGYGYFILSLLFYCMYICISTWRKCSYSEEIISLDLAIRIIFIYTSINCPINNLKNYWYVLNIPNDELDLDLKRKNRNFPSKV